jgi:thiamine-phosphate pyrophosphorylase
MPNPDPVKPRQAARQLYLVTPPVADAESFASQLSAMLQAVNVAAVLLRLESSDERTLLNRIKTIAPAVQDRGVALLLEGHPHLVARGGADGAHLSSLGDFLNAAETLKPERIAGCGGLPTRHDAMEAGERGADYVMFGDPVEGLRPPFDAVVEKVRWWTEIFEIPCVALAESPDEVGALAAAGADFVALGDFIWTGTTEAVTALTAAAAQLAAPEPVA